MRLALAVLLTCALGAQASWAQPEMNLDELLSVLETMRDSISDVAVTYDFGVIEPDNAATIERARQQGVRILVEPIHTELFAKKPFREMYKVLKDEVTGDTWGNNSKRHAIQAYNSKQAKFYEEYEPSGRQSGQKKAGVVANMPPRGLSVNSTPLGYTIFHEDEADDRTKLDVPQYIRYLRAQPLIEVTLRNEVQRVNDCNAICVEAWLLDKPGGSRTTLLRRYCCSVDHSFALIRIRLGETAGYDVLSLTKLSNGAWFPTEGRMSASPDSVANTIKVTKVSVNQGLTAKDLDIAFPSGTKVEDRITGNTYMVKPTQEELDKTLPK